MEPAGIFLAAPMELPLLWSWTWVAVVLVVFLSFAAVSAFWIWVEYQRDRRRQVKNARTHHGSPRSNELPKAA